MNADPSLAELAQAAARGDRAAFDQLHRRFGGGLRRLFMTRTAGRDDLAEDLSQRAWLACWRAMVARKYDPARSAFSTYLYAIASRVWLEHLRQAGRAGGTSQVTGFEASLAGDDPAGVARAAEVIDLVRAALGAAGGEAGLNEEDRALLRASADGASDRDLAKRLGLAPSTVNVRKRAALERLRRYLAARGYRGEAEADREAEQRAAGNE